MTYGYSQSLVTANKKAVGKSPGVALGRVCISIGISESQVSAILGVSICVSTIGLRGTQPLLRHTVYK